ncbi:DUF4192 domain-containing protein [Arthrobacter sp. HLT1-20]
MGKQVDKIRVSAGEDLLAFIPHMMGYWPQESIVCIGMNGKMLRATMRLDLPPDGSGETAQLAHIAASQMAGDHQANGCLIAIFGREDWLDSAHCPQSRLYRQLRKAFGRVGLPVRDAWYVGTGHWRSLECSSEECCPWPGKDNSSIRESFVNAEFIFRGSMVRESPREQIAALTAVQDAGFALAVASAGEKYREVLARSGSATRQLAVTLGAWEQSLQRWPQTPDQQMSAYLLASLGHVSVRDTLMVALATSCGYAFAGAAANGLLQRNAGPLVVPANWFGGNQAAEQQPSMDQITRAHVPAELFEAAGRDFGAILLGGDRFAGNGGAAVAPDWPRLDGAEPLLTFLAASTDGADKAPVLCILGWIQWCKGRGTWAGSYFAACEAQQPGYKLAGMLDQLLSVGYIAECAKNPRTAWPGYQGDGEPREEAA